MTYTYLYNITAFNFVGFEIFWNFGSQTKKAKGGQGPG